MEERIERIRAPAHDRRELVEEDGGEAIRAGSISEGILQQIVQRIDPRVTTQE
ncbi:hypothetical protein GCM10009784_21610 [Arthrobacter parietis]|uniref:Uncharacterized protein n=1 Tax=Arthrobacter parietis TaxID=271434 RepID=A0ABP5MT03_9MICC